MVHHEPKHDGQKLELLQTAQFSFLASPVSFESYMDWKLYDPTWGYYQTDRLGLDFFTTPMKSNALAYALWVKLKPMLQSWPYIHWLEVGPGRLELSHAMLLLFEKNNIQVESITLLEKSAALRAWQADHIAKHWPESWQKKVELIDELKDDLSYTVCVGHEVLDAIPVSRVCYQKGRWYELSVHLDQGIVETACAVETLRPETPWQDQDYIEGSSYEVCHLVKPWLESILQRLSKSIMMWADYGDDAYHFYHPQRFSGTIRGYYEGQMVPWSHPGADLTADVNWSDVGSIIKPFADCLTLERQSALMANALPEIMASGVGMESCHRYFFDPTQMDRRIQVMTALLC